MGRELVGGRLKAAAVSVNITPPVGCALAGYGAREKCSSAVEDELLAKVLFVDDGTTRAAVYRSKIPVIEQFVREAAARAGQARQPGRAAPRMGGPEPVGNCYPTYTVLDSLVPRTPEARER